MGLTFTFYVVVNHSPNVQLSSSRKSYYGNYGNYGNYGVLPGRLVNAESSNASAT